MFELYRKLESKGVLGINRRNSQFILKHNVRKLYPLVDDKLRTKKLAEAAGIAVPRLYEVVEFQGQVKGLAGKLASLDDFVIKPAHGSGGEGILVISGRSKDLYRKANGILISQEEMNYHVSRIISGVFSLGGQPDKALIEYRVVFDPIFAGISYQGAPDIRIIVFLGVPVMAMVRLPTRSSDGKANLHQGAIGAGIDIATGATLRAVWFNKTIEEHPDTGNSISNITIPQWPKLLELAARCYEITGLGYQGVDIVLDAQHGPLILELNARPGLNIQIANSAGIRPRLELIEKHALALTNVDERVAFATENFRATPSAQAF